MRGTWQPAKVEHHAVRTARRGKAQQLPMVAAFRAANGSHAVGGQQRIGVGRGLRLDIQPDHPAIFPGNAA